MVIQQRKHQRFALLALCFISCSHRRWIHRWLVDSPYRGPVLRKECTHGIIMRGGHNDNTSNFTSQSKVMWAHCCGTPQTKLETINLQTPCKVWNRNVIILTKFSSLVNFQHSQWQKFYQNDDISISIFTANLEDSPHRGVSIVEKTLEGFHIHDLTKASFFYIPNCHKAVNFSYLLSFTSSMSNLISLYHPGISFGVNHCCAEFSGENLKIYWHFA